MTTATFNPAMGGEAIAAANAKPVFAGDRKIKYFSIKNDGDSVMIRFLTPINEMMVVKRHDYVPTKPAPAGMTNTAAWPTSMSVVCRKDNAFGGHYPSCPICDTDEFSSKYNPGKKIPATAKTWAIAVLRHVVTRPDGSKAIEDVPREVQIKDGDNVITRQERSLVVVCMAGKNFWGGVMAMAGRLEGSICDRDWTIIRQGTGTDTNYVPMPGDPDPILRPGTEGWESYLRAMNTQGYDLRKIIPDGASDEFFVRFFDKTRTLDKDGNIIPVQGTAPTAATQTKLDDQLAKLRGLADASPSAGAGAPAYAGADPWAAGNNGFVD